MTNSINLTETEIQEAIVAWLEAQGHLVVLKKVTLGYSEGYTTAHTEPHIWATAILG